MNFLLSKYLYKSVFYSNVINIFGTYHEAWHDFIIPQIKNFL